VYDCTVCTRHWAVDVESGNAESGMEHNSTCSVFSVVITLTDEGLDHLCLVRFVMLLLLLLSNRYFLLPPPRIKLMVGWVMFESVVRKVVCVSDACFLFPICCFISKQSASKVICIVGRSNNVYNVAPLTLTGTVRFSRND